MKTSTILKTITMFSTFACFSGLTYAQTDDAESVKIIINKTKIVNGDTTVEEKILTGEEAMQYQKRHEHMSEIRHLRKKHAHGHGRTHGPSHRGAPSKKVIVHTNKTGHHDMESIHRYDYDDGHKQVIVKTISEGGGHEPQHIEIDDDQIIIINADGEEKIIEIDKADKVHHIEHTRNGKKVNKIIIIDDIEIEETEKEVKSATDVSKKRNKEIGMELYPNPNNGKFTVEVKLTKKEEATLEVVDINGKSVYKETIKGGDLQKIQIDLQSHGKGIYFVNLTSQNEALSEKVMVE